MLQHSSILKLELLHVQWGLTPASTGSFTFPTATPGTLQVLSPDDGVMQFCGRVHNCKTISLLRINMWDLARVKWILAHSQEFLERFDLGLDVKDDTSGACYICSSLASL